MQSCSDSLQVVDNDSAVFDSEHSENIPLAKDHHHLVRFSSPDDDAYHTVSQTLKRKVTQLLHEVAQSAHNGKSLFVREWRIIDQSSLRLLTKDDAR